MDFKMAAVENIAERYPKEGLLNLHKTIGTITFLQQLAWAMERDMDSVVSTLTNHTIPTTILKD